MLKLAVGQRRSFGAQDEFEDCSSIYERGTSGSFRTAGQIPSRLRQLRDGAPRLSALANQPVVLPFNVPPKIGGCIGFGAPWD